MSSHIYVNPEMEILAWSDRFIGYQWLYMGYKNKKIIFSFVFSIF